LSTGAFDERRLVRLAAQQVRGKAALEASLY
jgi:hypothetical protein